MKLNKTRISSLTMSSEDFFSEFYHPDEIVTENEVLSISCALPI